MVIFGAMLLVTVPSITKTLKQKDEDEYKRFLNDIYLATESYIGMRVEEYPELVYSNKAVVELKELIDAGYISENKRNPKANEIINPKETVEITKDNSGFYSYKLSGKENGFSSYITDGLMLWYDGKKHGSEEYVWNDLSGNGKHAILDKFKNNASIVWKNNGLEFDGIDDFLSMEFTTDFSPALTVTTTYKTYTSIIFEFAWSFYYSKNPIFWYDYRLTGGYGHGQIHIASNDFKSTTAEYNRLIKKIGYPSELHSETIVVIPK